MAVFGTINNILPTFTLVSALSAYILYRLYMLEGKKVKENLSKLESDSALKESVKAAYEGLREARTIWGIFVAETVFLSCLYAVLLIQIVTAQNIAHIDYLAYSLGALSLLFYLYIESSHGDILWIPRALYGLSEDG